jgi:Leucine-rich repeat (LRR) protein
MKHKKTWSGTNVGLGGMLWLVVMASLLGTSFWFVMGNRSVEAAPTLQAFNCQQVTQIPVTECQALVTLYEKTNGQGWKNADKWLATTTPCDWFGVNCIVWDNAESVSYLNLQGNRLTGSIPDELGNLPNLRTLSLGSNRLIGAIPGVLGELDALTELVLDSNRLTGSIPDELGNLPNLRTLSLGGNSLAGAIPGALGGLDALTVLSLYGNRLTGTIPISVVTLPELLTLSLQRNSLDGPLPRPEDIPVDKKYFPRLQSMNLFYNKLSGHIPPALLQLAQLSTLNLADNKLSGPLSDVNENSSLHIIALENNLLSGAIPPSFGHLRLDRPGNILNLSRNQLTGNIPLELCNLDRAIDLNYNKLIVDAAIENCFPELGNDWVATQTVPPTEIKSSTITSDTIRLTWTPIRYIADDGYYEISGRVLPTGTYSLYVTTTLTTDSVLLPDLLPDTSYEFRLRSYTLRDNLSSEHSDPILATPRRTYVVVRDDTGAPYAGAVVYVYRGNQPIAQATTGDDGHINANHLFTNGDTLRPGDEVVALVERYAHPADRELPDRWAYKVYNTSMARQADGSFLRHQIDNTGGEQTLTVSVSNTLVLFDLLVSVEWDAHRIADARPEIPYDTFLKQVQRGLTAASAFLYDATDGQFAFGDITIVDGGRYWDKADLQLLASSQVRPSAMVGGIVNEPTTYTSTVGNATIFSPGFLRMGRAWNRYSGRVGRLDEEDAYRTLVHEFSHYAFGLYDAYLPISYTVAATGTTIFQPSCTSPAIRHTTNDEALASLMDWHYTASEFSLRPTGGQANKLWSDECKRTQQWLTHGESDWETIIGMYQDKQNSPPRWRFASPDHAPNPGPDLMPLTLPRIKVTSTFTVASPEIVVLDVVNEQGQFLNSQQAQIYLLKMADGKVTKIIDQGTPDSLGRIDLLGIADGDILKAITWDGTRFVSQNYNSTVRQIQLAPSAWRPVVDATPLVSAGSVGLTVTVVVTEALPNPLSVQLFGVGSILSQTITLTPHADNTHLYSGVALFGAEQAAFREGHLWVYTSDENGQLLETVTTYAIGGSPGSHGHAYPPIDPASSDGIVRVNIPDGQIAKNAHVIVLPTRGLPGAHEVQIETTIPTVTLVSTPFAIRASDGITQMIAATDATAITPTLTMFYNQSAIQGYRPENLRIYYWVEESDQWQCVGGVTEPLGNAIVTYVRRFGIYAIMASGLPGC